MSTKSADRQSSGMLRSADLYLSTDISGQPISPTFKGQTVQKDFFFLFGLFDPYSWDVTQRTVVISYDVSGQPMVRTFLK